MIQDMTGNVFTFRFFSMKLKETSAESVKGLSIVIFNVSTAGDKTGQ